MTNRVAKTLDSDYREIIERIRGREVVNVEETRVKVNGRQYWIWIFITLKETLVVIKDSRGSNVPKEILGEGFKRIIVTDGWKA
jgi:transposase-like protein